MPLKTTVIGAGPLMTNPVLTTSSPGPIQPRVDRPSKDVSAGVGVGDGSGVGVGVGVGSGVGVGAGVGFGVGIGVGLAITTGIDHVTGTRIGVCMAVGVVVGSAVDQGVAVARGVALALGKDAGVEAAIGIGTGKVVGVAFAFGVAVGIGVGVGVGQDVVLGVSAGAGLDILSPVSEAGASVTVVWDVGLGVVGGAVLSEELIIRVNFSMELGGNARESPEIDVAAGIARARSGRSATVRVAASLTVLAAARLELRCFAGRRGEEAAFFGRTDEARLCGVGFDLRVLLLCFRRDDVRWSFRVGFRTGEGDGETSDDALALRAEGVPTAATALGAEDRQPTNRATTHAVEMQKLRVMRFQEQRPYRGRAGHSR